MALALENGHTSYRPTFKENFEQVTTPFVEARKRFPNAALPTLMVKEVTRMGRDIDLTEERVVQGVLAGKGVPVSATLEDTQGRPVNGNLSIAAREAAPYKRVSRGRRGFSSDRAYDLGIGRLRLVLR